MGRRVVAARLFFGPSRGRRRRVLEIAQRLRRASGKAGYPTAVAANPHRARWHARSMRAISPMAASAERRPAQIDGRGKDVPPPVSDLAGSGRAYPGGNDLRGSLGQTAARARREQVRPAAVGSNRVWPGTLRTTGSLALILPWDRVNNERIRLNIGANWYFRAERNGFDLAFVFCKIICRDGARIVSTFVLDRMRIQARRPRDRGGSARGAAAGLAYRPGAPGRHAGSPVPGRAPGLAGGAPPPRGPPGRAMVMPGGCASVPARARPRSRGGAVRCHPAHRVSAAAWTRAALPAPPARSAAAPALADPRCRPAISATRPLRARWGRRDRRRWR